MQYCMQQNATECNIACDKCNNMQYRETNATNATNCCACKGAINALLTQRSAQAGLKSDQTQLGVDNDKNKTKNCDAVGGRWAHRGMGAAGVRGQRTPFLPRPRSPRNYPPPSSHFTPVIMPKQREGRRPRRAFGVPSSTPPSGAPPPLLSKIIRCRRSLSFVVRHSS